MEEKISKRC